MVNKIYYKRIQKNKIMTAKELASKKTLTKVEKAFLTDEATRLNINFEIRPDCSSCYQDLALQIYKLEKENVPVEETTTIPKFILKKGFDSIIVGTGERINEATITDEIAKQLFDRGLKSIFEVVPDENNN